MENKTNQVLELANGKEYVVLRQVVYKGDTYYVTSEIHNDGDDFDKNLTLLKETIEDEKTYVNIVRDPDIIKVVMNHIA
jgi:hypothetical protein